VTRSRLDLPSGARCRSLAGDELLPAVDVVGRARECRVGHEVYRERGDIGRSDDAPDGKRGAELFAAVFELVAEERCRERRVDEAGRDEVDFATWPERVSQMPKTRSAGKKPRSDWKSPTSLV
jgi:hypothetical protein